MLLLLLLLLLLNIIFGLNNRDFLLSLLIPAFSDLRMSEDEADTPVAESSIGKALKEQCKLDKDMLGMMKVISN